MGESSGNGAPGACAGGGAGSVEFSGANESPSADPGGGRGGCESGGALLSTLDEEDELGEAGIRLRRGVARGETALLAPWHCNEHNDKLERDRDEREERRPATVRRSGRSSPATGARESFGAVGGALDSRL
jgi:hypothetical protein